MESPGVARRTARAALVVLMLTSLADVAPAGVDPWRDPSRVLVVYNALWPDDDGDGVGDSREVAVYYALRRGVPADNLLGLPLTPTTHRYTAAQWGAFLSELRDPIIAWLEARGADSVHTLLFCYGVPYQVNVPGAGVRSVDGALCVPYALGTAAAPDFDDELAKFPYREVSPHIPPDKGHFDHALYDFDGSPLYLHARLDGSSAEHAKALVDRALYAERHADAAPGGYHGFGYVDSRLEVYADAELLDGYPFNYKDIPRADKSIAYGKFYVSAAGLPVRWEPFLTEIGDETAQFVDGSSATDAPRALVYGGWYNLQKYRDRWEWLAGSVACDVNSNSANGLRDPETTAFLTRAFERNLTCGAGSITEPLLNGHNRPDVLLAYVLDGFPWAEAAMLSDPGVKWMSVHVGDPLYVLDLTDGEEDTSAPAPVAWLGRDGTTLELELPAVPAGAPGGAEVFRCTARTTGTATDLVTEALGQPDDRRLQLVDLPAGDPSALAFVRVELADPAGNTASTPLLHYMPGPPAAARVIATADESAVSQADRLVLRLSLSAAGGLDASDVSFTVRLTAPAYRFDDVPVTARVLDLARSPLATRALDQWNVTVVFPPYTWQPGTLVFDATLSAAGETSSSRVVVDVLP